MIPTVYHAIVLTFLVVMTVIAAVNVIMFPSLVFRGRAKRTPRVSVLIPARNEAANLNATLASIVNQQYENIEIIVLDDNSEDGTFEIALRESEKDSRIKVIRGRPLSRGWVGKTFACHQLAEHATGDLLLFVDADTVQSRTSIAAVVAELESTGAHLLTVIPRQSMIGFWEKVLLPLLHFSTFCYLPMPLVSITRSPKLAMANGQFMLFRADAYRSIGGHASVRAALVEDVWLARRVKEHGRKLVIRYGAAEVSCRMYSSFRQIWDGFSKNLFPGFNYSLAMIGGVVIFNVITSVVPFVAVAGGVAWGSIGTPWFLAAAIEGGLVILIRLLFAARFDMDRWPVLLHPVAMVVFLGIALNSVRSFVVGQGARWKGRLYRAHDQVVSL